MRTDDGQYECGNCGTFLDGPFPQQLKAVIHGASGKPNLRVLTMEGVELHRCEIRTGIPGNQS